MTLDELAMTFHPMVDNKSLGLNGFPSELYEATWHFVGTNLLCMHKEASHPCSLGVGINQRFIRCIPKYGNPEIIMN